MSDRAFRAPAHGPKSATGRRVAAEPVVCPRLDPDRPYTVFTGARSIYGDIEQVCLKEFEGHHPPYLTPAGSDWFVRGDGLLSTPQTTRAIAAVSRVEPSLLLSHVLEVAAPEQLPDALPRWLFARLVGHPDGDVRRWALRRPPGG